MPMPAPQTISLNKRQLLERRTNKQQTQRVCAARSGGGGRIEPRWWGWFVGLERVRTVIRARPLRVTRSMGILCSRDVRHKALHGEIVLGSHTRKKADPSAVCSHSPYALPNPASCRAPVNDLYTPLLMRSWAKCSRQDMLH